MAERKGRRERDGQRPNPFKVGDILDYAWGYDQTNREFYQVTEVRARSVTVRRIATRTSGEVGFMTEYLTPKPGTFLEGKNGRSMTKLVKWYEDRPLLSMDFGSANLWDGKPKHQSWYA